MTKLAKSDTLNIDSVDMELRPRFDAAGNILVLAIKITKERNLLVEVNADIVKSMPPEIVERMRADVDESIRKVVSVCASSGFGGPAS